MTSVFNPNNVNVNVGDVVVVNEDEVNLTNLFVNQSGDQMTGSLTLMGNETKIIFPDGTQQTTAFDSSRAEQLDTLISLVSNIANTGDELIISGNTTIMGGLILPENTLSFSNVSNLGSSFNQVNASINNINNNLNTMITDISILNNLNIGTTLNNHGNSINALETNLLNLSNELDNSNISINYNNQLITNNRNDIDAINEVIDDIQDDLIVKQTAINTNLNNIQALITNVNGQNDTINNLNNQVVGLSNEVNKIATVSNIEDLNESVADVVILVGELQNTVSSLSSLQDIDLTNFQDINDTLNEFNNFQGNQTILNETYNDNDAILLGFKTVQEELNNTLTVDISNLKDFKTDQEEYNTLNDTNISSLQLFEDNQIIYNQTNDNNLITINNAIATKQNIINSTNKLSIDNVNLGSSSLSHVDITSSLTGKLNALDNKDISHDNSISSINSSITTLQAADVIHDNQINTLNGNITTIQNNLNTKMDIINGSNLLSSELIETALNETLDETLINLENEINTKMDIIDVNNKLGIGNIDLTGSSLSYIDISSNLQQQLTNMTNAISTLEGLQDSDITSFQTIQDNFDTLENLVNTKQDIINDTTNKLPSSHVDYTSSALRFVDISSNLQAQLDSIAQQAGNAIPSISYDSNNTTTTIADTTIIETLEFLDNTQQTTAFTSQLQTKITTNETDISNLDTRLTTAENSITTNTNDILTKNDIIDINNKLSISLIDLETHQLNYVDSGLTGNISISLGELNTSMNALQLSDESQTTSITNLTTSVNNLTNNKQDLVNGSNLLSSEFIAYNATNVKNELDTINNEMTTYAPLNNPTFTGTVSGITKSMVGLSNVDNVSDLDKPISSTQQTALNLKQNINNAVFTGYIQTPRIFENIATSFTSFTSNILTYDYSNGSILYFEGLTSTTNFRLDLNNVNSINETNRSFTFSLIINTTTYKAYASTFRLDGTAYTLIASGGLSNLLPHASSISLIQSFTIVYTTSSTVPYQVFTNLSSYF